MSEASGTSMLENVRKIYPIGWRKQTVAEVVSC